MTVVHWPWFVGGAALAGVALLHWFTLHRMMAVSGRFTALVNRARFGPVKPAPKMSAEELRAALIAATAAEFGPDAVEGAAAAPSAPRPAVAKKPALTQPQGLGLHVLFLVALVAGGLLSSLLAGTWSITGTLRGELFTRFFPGSVGPAVLLFGGVLVGFGTRMAAGCTSGHGLCGVSRLQPGSLVTTAAFFGMGIVTSFVLRGVL
jgi:uncharacterized membrane protein YedE/YeeE